MRQTDRIVALILALGVVIGMGMAARVGSYQRRNPPGPCLIGGARGPVTHAPGEPIATQVFIAPGADLTADPETWPWVDITGYVRWSEGISVTIGTDAEASSAASVSATMTLNNHDDRFNADNPTGPYYGGLTSSTPIWAKINPGNGTYDLVQGYINEWRGQVDTTLNHRVMSITVGGTLRRLRQNNPPAASPQDRILIDWLDRRQNALPLGWWPLTVDLSSSQPGIASGILTSTPLGSGVRQPFTLVTGPNVLGTDALIDLSNGTRLSFPIAPHDLPSARYIIRWVATYKPGSNPAGNATVMTVEFGDGDLARVDVYTDASGNFAVLATNTAGVAGTVFDTVYNPYDGQQRFFTLAINQRASVPSDSQATLFVDEVLSAQSNVAAIFGHVSSIELGDAANESFMPAVGQLTAWSNEPPPGDEHYFAARGNPGETASDRWYRLCVEAGIAADVLGDPAVSPPMGPQPPGRLLDLLGECVRTDGGVMGEAGFGLSLRTAGYLQNAPVALTVDFRGGAVSQVPEYVRDDLGAASLVRAVDPVGRSAAWPEDPEVGSYETQININPEDADQLLSAAQWAYALGQSQDTRWPILPLCLSNGAGRTLIAAFTALRPSDRVALTNLPSGLASDDQDLFAGKITHRFRPQLWDVVLGCTSAAPWRAFTIEPSPGSGNVGRLGLTQTLSVDADSVTTTLSVATPGSDPLLTTTAAFPTDFPLDVVISGERMSITAVSGASSPQTVTVVRSVNGVVKSHLAGAELELYRPGVMAL